MPSLPPHKKPQSSSIIEISSESSDFEVLLQKVVQEKHKIMRKKRRKLYSEGQNPSTESILPSSKHSGARNGANSRESSSSSLNTRRVIPARQKAKKKVKKVFKPTVTTGDLFKDFAVPVVGKQKDLPTLDDLHERRTLKRFSSEEEQSEEEDESGDSLHSDDDLSDELPATKTSMPKTLVPRPGAQASRLMQKQKEAPRSTSLTSSSSSDDVFSDISSDEDLLESKNTLRTKNGSALQSVVPQKVLPILSTTISRPNTTPSTTGNQQSTLASLPRTSLPQTSVPAATSVNISEDFDDASSSEADEQFSEEDVFSGSLPEQELRPSPLRGDAAELTRTPKSPKHTTNSPTLDDSSEFESPHSPHSRKRKRSPSTQNSQHKKRNVVPSPILGASSPEFHANEADESSRDTSPPTPKPSTQTSRPNFHSPLLDSPSPKKNLVPPGACSPVLDQSDFLSSPEISKPQCRFRMEQPHSTPDKKPPHTVAPPSPLLDDELDAEEQKHPSTQPAASQDFDALFSDSSSEQKRKMRKKSKKRRKMRVVLIEI